MEPMKSVISSTDPTTYNSVPTTIIQYGISSPSTSSSSDTSQIQQKQQITEAQKRAALEAEARAENARLIDLPNPSGRSYSTYKISNTVYMNTKMNEARFGVVYDITGK
jgi:hypothetical protein